MLITNVSEQDQCEIPALPEPALTVLLSLCVGASPVWKVKLGRRMNLKCCSDLKKISRTTVTTGYSFITTFLLTYT